MNFNNFIIGTINSCTKVLNLRIEYKYKKISLDLVLEEVDNIILRILQLKKVNLLIKQYLKDLIFKNNIINKVLLVLKYKSLLVVAQTREEIANNFKKGNIIVL